MLYIKDLGSANGTIYQELKIYDETPVVSGGIVQIGLHPEWNNLVPAFDM